MSESQTQQPLSPRLRRLFADHQALLELAERSELIDIAPGGDPPDRYRVRYRCKGLAKEPNERNPKIAETHICDFYLHRDYPQRPPVFAWRTPVFHPNILPPERGGTVCIGAWAPAESLAALVVRIGEMIQYKNYDLSDVLNQEVVGWVRRHQDRFPIDDRPLAPGF